MSTTYVVFCDVYHDPVWGPQIIECVNSGLVRVFRNRLQKAVFEYVGNPKYPFNLTDVVRRYPILKFADENSEPLIYKIRKRAPLPAEREGE